MGVHRMSATPEQTAELLRAFDDMLARWWSNATQSDKELGNRAARARAAFMGDPPPSYPNQLIEWDGT